MTPDIELGSGRWLEECVVAHEESASIVRHTPLLPSPSLSAKIGANVALKAESLQATGSFKLRGALNKLRHLPAGAPGVVAGSAGNHAQALAYAARRDNIPCEIFMPDAAPISKREAVRSHGAVVASVGANVDGCVAMARERADETGWEFVHPFDDPRIVTGQGGVGLELLEDCPDVTTVVVPVGGGGLASGIAMAVKLQKPDAKVIGVRPERVHQTIADGIAIKQPGELTRPLIDRWLDDMVIVSDDLIASALASLLEGSKLVAEGAGAAAVAALLSDQIEIPTSGSVVAIVSGGNIDLSLLSTLASRHETRSRRRMLLFGRIADAPGGLAALLAAIAQARANVIEVDHLRDGVELGVGQTGVEIAIETRGAEHSDELVSSLVDAGFEVGPLDPILANTPIDGLTVAPLPLEEAS